MKMHCERPFLSAATAGILLVSPVVSVSQPIITEQPQSLTNLVGTSAAFSASVSGAPLLAYQWFFNSTFAIPQATNAELIITNVQKVNAGNYSVVVTNLEGAVTSTLATLTILTPPTITKQPTDQTGSLFADATFRVIAAGDAPLTYQWRFDDVDLVDETNVSFTVRDIQRTNVGTYSVVVSNFSGSTTSQVATLTITPFNAIYEFGYSWTDTQGIGCNWPPPDFYMGRACNGPMWPEFLSPTLGLAYVASNNYAHCGAGPADLLNQVGQYTAPPKPELSLYFLMFCDDILNGLPGFGTYLDVTNESAWLQLVQTGIQANSNAVARLYAKGARAVVVQSEMDFSRSPAALAGFGTNTAKLSKMGEYCTLYNTGFSNALNAFSQTKPDLRIVWVDMFSKLDEVLASPAEYGFTQTTIGALDDPALTNKSFTGPGADYVWWNRLHPTSKLHELISIWNSEALTNSRLEKLSLVSVVGPPIVQMSHLQIGRDYTLQKSADLDTWQDVETFTASAGTNQWSASTRNDPAGYFRLRWQR
jgi:hypothetical protein